MLALLGTAFGLHEALLLLVGPVFLTNIWQAASGGCLPTLLMRLWPMLLTTIPGVYLGTRVLLGAEQAALDVLLGIALCAYALLSLSGARFVVPPGRERALGSVTGVMTGLVAGATGTLVLPAVPYLSALGLQRDELVQAMGLSFALSSLTLGVILAAEGAATPEGVTASLFMVVPALAGMVIGQRLRLRLRLRLRQRIAPSLFRQGLFFSLLILGAKLVRRGLPAVL